MNPDDASDVAKALAAFGAPAIRYRNFGQGSVKPSSVVQTRPEPAPPPPVVLRQAEPERRPLAQAPRPRVPATATAPGAPAGAAPMPPMPAFRRTIDPTLVALRNATVRSPGDVALADPLAGVPRPPVPLAAPAPRDPAPAGPRRYNLRDVFSILAEEPAAARRADDGG